MRAGVTVNNIISWSFFFCDLHTPAYLVEYIYDYATPCLIYYFSSLSYYYYYYYVQYTMVINHLGNIYEETIISG